LELARRAAKAWKKFLQYNTNRCLRQAKRLYEAAEAEARLIGDPIAEKHFRSEAHRVFEFWRLKNNAYMPLSDYEYSHLRLPASYKKGG
jgi:hypothetical protein